MPESWYEPLTAMDRQFLEAEDANTPMHVCGISRYDVGPLRSETGGLDAALIGKAIEGILHRIPRYRQKLAWTPFEDRPVWIDDADFDLDYHLRYIALPSPGNDAQLKRLTGLIVSQPLDRSRPLWEKWFVEGLEGGQQYAIITKLHHCMIDGGGGVNLMGLLMSRTPEFEVPTPPPFRPRPAPSELELVGEVLGRRASAPLRVVRGAGRFVRETPDVLGAVGRRVRAVGDLLANVLPASETPINQPLGPHRSVDWLETPLEELTSLRRSLGCTLNDLALTVVTGAFRRYLTRLGVALEGLDFRVSIPVNVRRGDESDDLGNRVSSWIIRLPLERSDPFDQLDAISHKTGELKQSHMSLAVEMIMATAEEVPGMLALIARANGGQYNTLVTNVPGPPMPLYMLGSRARGMQPFVLLMPKVGLGIALLSYDGVLHWGLQADRDQVPDLGVFREDLRDSLEELARCARARATRGAHGRRAR